MSSQDVRKIFGENVRKVRKSKELTQEELADKTGLHSTYIGQVERGRRNPSLINICKIIKALNVTSTSILP